VTRQSRAVEATRACEAFCDHGGLELPGLLHHANGVIRNDDRFLPLKVGARHLAGGVHFGALTANASEVIVFSDS